MDSFWQLHRTFVMKILGGLAVCLVFWIIGSSLTDMSLERRDDLNRGKVAALTDLPVASEEDRDAYEEAVEILEERIRFLAQKVGETRQGEELRQGLIRDVLKLIGKDTDENRNRFLELARGNPNACVGRLVGEARDFLVTQAGLRNVFIDEELGFGRIDRITQAELDRYLLTLLTIVRAVDLAIREEVFEIRSIGYGSPPGGRFEAESIFIREYPVSLEVKGPSKTVLAFIQKLSDGDRFLPVAELKLHRPGSERNPDNIVAEIELRALRIDPEGEATERHP